MSEKEMNAYRFTSGQEPSDEMLAQIMKEVTQEAVEKHKKAAREHFAEMQNMIALNKALWQEQIDKVIHG